MGIFCLLFQPKLAALASGELPQTLAVRVERHVGACLHCQQEWALQQRLVKALRGAAPLPAASSPFLWERLEAAIQSEAPRPPVFHPRRLAPLGGLALAGAAAAAVFVAYPQGVRRPPNTPQSISRPEINDRVKVAKVTPALAPKDLTALDKARLSETKIALNKPVSDPFAPQGGRTTPSAFPRRKHLPPLTAKNTAKNMVKDTLLPTKINAVAHLELGAVHIQTAEFNREVKEAEELERSSAQRATSTPTDAIASARGEANLGIFQ
ncbi:anti-sigma factor family protein [Armatimonas sp.]|uniref:anti-sigma factor family protein n=1 Tax=Armatimonas sp. TaxID=1872638 RepID=UPI00374D3C1F